MMITGRTHVIVDFANSGYDEPSWIQCRKDDANCVASMCRGDNAYHLPVFDVDVPRETAEDRIAARFTEALLRWVPSTTEGHHHVYMDYPILWEDYKIRLQLLIEADIVEHGYLYAATKRGMTICRLPHVKKVVTKAWAPTDLSWAGSKAWEPNYVGHITMPPMAKEIMMQQYKVWATAGYLTPIKFAGLTEA